jgi:hypothetical protein
MQLTEEQECNKGAVVLPLCNNDFAALMLAIVAPSRTSNLVLCASPTQKGGRYLRRDFWKRVAFPT